MKRDTGITLEFTDEQIKHLGSFLSLSFSASMLTLFVKWLSTSGGETSEKDQAQFYVIVITIFNFIYGVLTLGISNLAESSARMWRGAGTREKKRRKVKIRVLNYEPIDD